MSTVAVLNLKKSSKAFAFFLTAAALVLGFAISSQAGVIEGLVEFKVEQTRLYVNGDERKGHITVKNLGDVPLLLVPRVYSVGEDGGEGERVRDFLVTPAMTKVQPQKRETLSVVRLTEKLPKDRESLHYLKLHVMPATSKRSAEEERSTITNSMAIYANMFYRPEGLIDPRAVAKSCPRVEARRTKHAIELKNPTPYWLVLSEIRIGEKFFKRQDRAPRLAPFGTLRIPNSEGGKLSLKCRQETGTLVETKVTIR